MKPLAYFLIVNLVAWTAWLFVILTVGNVKGGREAARLLVGSIIVYVIVGIIVWVASNLRPPS